MKRNYIKQEPLPSHYTFRVTKEMKEDLKVLAQTMDLGQWLRDRVSYKLKKLDLDSHKKGETNRQRSA